MLSGFGIRPHCVSLFSYLHRFVQFVWRVSCLVYTVLLINVSNSIIACFTKPLSYNFHKISEDASYRDELAMIIQQWSSNIQLGLSISSLLSQITSAFSRNARFPDCTQLSKDNDFRMGSRLTVKFKLQDALFLFCLKWEKITSFGLFKICYVMGF